MNNLTEKKTQELKFIKRVVHAFYLKASTDFMIGYHFRKIATKVGLHPLAPPIDAFKDHLPRIEAFWQLHLLGLHQSDTSFDLINSHLSLKIKKAELGRWLMLFRDTLDYELDSEDEFKKLWLSKLPKFQKMFERLF